MISGFSFCVAFCILLLKSFSRSEPVCSKFEYEERLLEKMIKLDFDYRNDIDEFKKTINDFKKELVLTKEQLADTREELAKLEKQFENVSLIRDGPHHNKHILFRAHKPKQSQPVKGEVIVFMTVETNIGDGYNSTTGVFTAPEAGIYLFTVQFCVPDGKNMYLGIFKDSTILNQGRIWRSGSDGQCMTIVAMELLLKNDSVSAKCTHVFLNENNTMTEDPSHHFTSFSGMMVTSL